VDDIRRGDPIEEDRLIQLIERAQRYADAGAFDGIYCLYADRVFRFLLVLLGNVEIAEGISSQVFLHLIKKIETYHIAPKGNVTIFSAWLYRLAYNSMIYALCKRRHGYFAPMHPVERMSKDSSIFENMEAKLGSEQNAYLSTGQALRLVRLD
jgi:DNA-directed RNA polymerase specialized sigma24 family protein